MAYRKFKADFLFTGLEMLDQGHILVTDEKGIIQATIPLQEAGEDIENLHGIISPGFVNCHCHLELSHLKGSIPEKIGLVDFLLSVIKQRNSPADVILQAISEGEREMKENGIVAVGDICNTTNTLDQKIKGNLQYHNFIETMGFPEAIAEQRFQDSYEMFSHFSAQSLLPARSCSIVPHAPYSVSKKLFELIANFPGNNLLTIHNQECEEENIFFESGNGDFKRLYKSLGIDISFFKPSGKRSLESYLPHFHNSQALILVHNVTTNAEDLEALKGRVHDDRNPTTQTINSYCCLCPNANEYISGMLPDIDLLIKNNCRIVVGTDSLASNHQLNILEELKTIQKKFPHIKTKTLLQWATINGSHALQVDKTTGSFEKGKKPGVVLIDNVDNGKLTLRSEAKRIL
ncbi:MAG: amidohydrolase family protein [Bacteroidetes bacterium]|nr:amidohydrolase family protein [Bacteroidota bacterium]MBS1974167.1 amidohydrolase family protein [Bacteroidota bacterium]